MAEPGSARTAARQALRLLGALAMLVMLGGTAARDGPFTPHFVSLRHDEVNVRAGPGLQYPIAWVFTRRGLPVEATAAFGNWLRIRDPEGATGWVHRRLVSSRRTALIVGGVQTLTQRPQPGARPVLRAENGVQGRLLACRGEWCEIEVAERTGWLPRRHLWGVYPEEEFD